MNTNRTKKLNMDEKTIEEVRFRMDREYEKVFLKKMEEMKIIKQTKAVKELNKNNPNYPATKFYNQLIQDDRKGKEILKTAASQIIQTQESKQTVKTTTKSTEKHLIRRKHRNKSELNLQAKYANATKESKIDNDNILISGQEGVD